MKLKVTLLAGAVLSTLASASAFAAGGQKSDGQKYCMNAATGGSSCGFTSLEQCQQTMRGRNGWCSEQIDFAAWAASHGQSSPAGTSENSFAYYPPGGKLTRPRVTREEQYLDELRRKDMPTKGVGAQ